MPKRQRTEAIKTRRLKKADLDVDFFFIGGSGVDSLSGKPEMEPKSYVRWYTRVNSSFGIF
jgi:hypothetical protein